MSKSLIHGENGFVPVMNLPKGKVTKHKVFIAGHSESGHHHVLESKVEFEVIEPANLGDSVFINLLAPAKVVHRKTFDIHETKILEPGLYQINHKSEYNPWTKVVDRVFD